MEELLPPYVERETDKFEVGAILATKDGRTIGNAYIVDVVPGTVGKIFLVRTQFHDIILNSKELTDWFYTPIYILKDTERWDINE